jgi:hypothetical protein
VSRIATGLFLCVMPAISIQEITPARHRTADPFPALSDREGAAASCDPSADKCNMLVLYDIGPSRPHKSRPLLHSQCQARKHMSTATRCALIPRLRPPHFPLFFSGTWLPRTPQLLFAEPPIPATNGHSPLNNTSPRYLSPWHAPFARTAHYRINSRRCGRTPSLPFG